MRREAAALGAEVEADVLGSTVARVRGRDGGRLLALVAHVDQVGVAVTHVFDDGLLGVCKLANWDAAAATGQRLAILTRDGVVPAVSVRAGTVKSSGTRSDSTSVRRTVSALALVRIGDSAVLAGVPEQLAGDRVTSAALDDRAGVYAAIEALRRLAADPPGWDVALVTTTQEEGAAAGARAVADRLRPDVAVVAEVTYATDATGPDPVEWGHHELGDGVAIFRGPVVSPIVTEGLLAVASAENIPFCIETGRYTSSDTDEIVGMAGGIPAGMVSIPLRSMHTANEVVDLGHVRATSHLLEAYARSLEPGVSFVR